MTILQRFEDIRVMFFSSDMMLSIKKSINVNNKDPIDRYAFLILYKLVLFWDLP